LESVWQAASFPLVPYSNRLGDAKLHWQGDEHTLVATYAAEPHALHGVGWMRPWTMLKAEQSFAVLQYHHHADAHWPFAFDASQVFRLEANGLEMRLSVTNRAAVPTPVGLGWHPYFVKRPGGHLAFEANGRWEQGPDRLPVCRLSSVGLQCSTQDLELDHCFDGWGGVVHLRDEVLHTRISSDLEHLVVYTGRGHDTIAIEPVSHVSNAMNRRGVAGTVNTAEGVRVLAPGESFTCAMRIEVEHME
jgi:aldose 1-epimerase